MIRIDNFSDLGNSNGVQSVSFVKSRGNSTTPVAAANNDIIMRFNSYVYNGNTYPKAVMVDTVAPVAANSTLTLANTAWTGGQFRVSTGNPNGNVANANANSNQNLLLFNQNGTLILAQGSPANSAFTIPLLNMISYGVAANSAGIGGIQLTQRARGNRDATSAVQNGDQLGALAWQGYNGNAFFGIAGRFAQVSANVNTAHGAIANGSSIPTDLNFVTCSNTTNFTTTLYGNGSASFPGNINVTGTATLDNINTGNIISGNINAFQSSISAGNVFSITLDNNSTQGILQTTYNNANIQTGTWTSWRQRGTQASPLPVGVGDEISKFSSVVYADSGNTYYLAAEQAATVISNDLAGNVDASFRTRVYGNGSAFNIMAPKLTVADTNDFGANATIYANGYIDTIGRLEYLRTFGSFTSNATQTSAGANTVNYMTLNNTEDSNGVSIVSNSQITIARTGRYDIQFSAELVHDTNQTANVEIWLTKNGNAVANTNTIVTLTKDEKAIAAWDWLVNANTANDYFQIAWASSDTNVEIIATDAANTIANVAAPSLIVTVVPVGA